MRRKVGADLDGLEDGHEDVRVVVGALVLQDGGEALEAHARVHVLVGQLAQGPVVLPVELTPKEEGETRAYKIVWS
jgi:hypothetical protein